MRVGATRWVARFSSYNFQMGNNVQPFRFRRSIRLRDYDYTLAGAYFVTLCTFNSACLFGDIVNGQMRLNDLGALVDREWQRTARVRQSVESDAFVVMPNHIHGILFILDDANAPGSSHLSKVFPPRSPTLQSGSLGAIIGQFKSTVARRARRQATTHCGPIWQRNYYEHIIRSDQSLNDIRKYIVENPDRWSDDRLYVEY